MPLLGIWGPVAILAGLVGSVLVFTKWRSHRRVSKLRAEFEPFHRALTLLLEELDGLVKRHDMLPFSDLDYDEPMAGETLRVYEEVASEAARLRARWTDLMEVRQQAATILDSTRVAKHDEERVRALLERTSELTELQKRRAECSGSLDRLEAAHEAVKPLFGAFETHAANVKELFDAIRAAGLSTVPYDDEWTACQELLIGAQDTRDCDPLGTAGVVPEINSRTEGLAEWLESVTRAFADARSLDEECTHLRKEVESVRADGVRLEGMRSSPDALVADAERLCGDALRSLDYGDVEAAGNALAGGRKSLESARKRVDCVLEAKAFYEKELPRKVAQLSELGAALPAAESRLSQLEAEHALRSWRHVRGHASQVRKVLERLEPLFDEAAAATTDAEQDYLRAAELLRRLERQQEHAGYLLDSVTDCLDHLTALRHGCRERTRQLGEEVRRHQGRMGAQLGVFGEDVERFLDDTEQLLEKIREESGGELPDWPIIEEHLDELAGDLEHIERAMESELEAHSRVRDAVARLRDEQSRLDELLRAHSEDRPNTNAAFRVARDRFAAAASRLEQGGGGWALLERELDGVGRDFSAVRRGVDVDISLASEARRALSEAESLLRDAKGRRARGVSRLIGQAESSLGEARRLLSEQAYERSTASAARAQDEARRALEEAEASVRAESAKRRRQRMETIVNVAAVGASVLGHVLRNAHSRGRRHGPWWRGGRRFPWGS